MNIQDWFPLGWTGWISLQSKGLSRVFNTTVQKHHFFGAQLSLWPNSHIHTWLWNFISKVMSLLFHMLSRFAIAFSSKEQVSFNFMAAVTICSDFGVWKKQFLLVFTVSPSICLEVMGLDAVILVSECWALCQLFHSPLSLSSRGCLVLLHFLP